MIVKNEDGLVQKGKLFDAIWDGAEEKTIKTVRDVLQFLHDFPIADVVSVVRCKDCGVLHNKWLGCPNLNGKIPPPDFYCARGERNGGAE